MTKRVSFKDRIMISFILVVGSVGSMRGEEKRLLTPQDCTNIRYPAIDDLSRQSAIQESPDHTTIAYVLQLPDIVSNDNKTVLYVRRIDGDVDRKDTPVLTNRRIAGIQWFPDNRHIAALVEIHGKRVLARIDTKTATLENISDPTEDAGDYSMDHDGDTFALSVRVAASRNAGVIGNADLEKGYRVSSSPTGYADAPRMREIYIIRRISNSHWGKPERLTFLSPLSRKSFSSLRMGGGMDISLSPNGRYLLVDNTEDTGELPARWRTSPYVSALKERWGFVLVSYLYDLSTKHVSIPLESPVVRAHALWSSDNRTFARIAVPPIGSTWERQDIDRGALSDHNTHLFTVDITTSVVNEVLDRAESEPLLWTDTGGLLIRRQDGSFSTVRQEGSQWIERASLRIPLADLSSYSSLTTDGIQFIGFYQNASIAPQLFGYNALTASLKVIAKLNPQVDDLVLPQIKRLQWKTSTGYVANGVLLLPPDYDPNRRYPLVIENGSITYSGEFACDSGVSHVSSFARGMLADAGIMYLMRSWTGNDNWEQNFYPKGYPGEISEAAFKMDLVESAIQYLDSRKMIDRTNVGIIGFSRGGWYTEYALAHSRIRYQAATVTDNVEYSYGAYWYFHSNSMQQSYDAMYGGPPYGKTLQNWRDHSISFNTEKIYTPVLKEVMGYGLRDDDPQRPPNNLAAHFELVAALNRQNKPVEMYYYPNELHQVEHPVARIASLQRNIDWFRFWLQGYERPNPEDPDQYKRWEHLRELRDADLKATQKQGQTDSGR
jgi:dipeptidyl aminopeptidase/acylaminoacyl peptidase